MGRGWAPRLRRRIFPAARKRQQYRAAVGHEQASRSLRDGDRWNSVFRLGRLPLSRASGRGPGRGRWQERSGPDPVENGLHFFQDLVVPKAQHDEASFAQENIAFRVTVEHLHTLGTIEFDDQSTLDAGEIDDVGADGMLATKLQAHHSMRTQEMPKAPLGVCGCSAQGSGSFL